MAIDLSVYQARMNTYNYETKNGRIDQEKNIILDGFNEHPSYQSVEIEGVQTDVHIVDDETLKKDIGRKIMLLKPEETTAFGRYVLWNLENWIVLNIDDNKDIQHRTLIQKCNVILKFYDECGVLREIPSSIRSKKTDNDLLEDKYMVLTDGELDGYMQSNEITSQIQEGTEFLFGEYNKCKYRVSFLNDFQRKGLYFLNLERDEINPEVDNLELGIANYANRPQFTLSITPLTAQIVPSSSVQLEYTLLDKDSQESDFNVIWTSSNEAVATIDETGILSSISVGTTTIKAEMECNPDVYDEITIEVTNSVVDNFELAVDNGNLEIIRTDTQLFVWSLLNNGSVIGSNFTFSIDSSTTANTDEYEFEVIDGNTYSIKCIEEGNNVVVNVLEDGGLNTQITYELVGYF